MNQFMKDRDTQERHICIEGRERSGRSSGGRSGSVSEEVSAKAVP